MEIHVRLAILGLVVWSSALGAKVQPVQDAETKDTNYEIGSIGVKNKDAVKKSSLKAVVGKFQDKAASFQRTPEGHVDQQKQGRLDHEVQPPALVRASGLKGQPPVRVATTETGEEGDPALAIKDGLITLNTMRTVILPPKQLIVLGVKAIRNTLEEAGGFYGLIRDQVLADIQNQINLQKELEMKIKLDGYRAQILHLQTLLGISDHWTMADIQDALNGQMPPELQTEIDNAVISLLFITDLNILYNTINNDKNVFVLRSPGDIITAISHYSEYSTTQLYVTQLMIDLSIYSLEAAATESYRLQFTTNAGYSYRYLQFTLGKTLNSLDAAKGYYNKQYLRRSAVYRNDKIALTELLSIQELLDASTGIPGSIDDSVFIRHADVVAFKRNFDSSKHNEWLGCYNGNKNCGSSNCMGGDEPFENLDLLPCMGEVFKIFAEKEGFIMNGDVVAINYNDAQLKGGTWWWLAVPKYSPDTRSCPGSSFAQGQPFDPTCEYERLRIWSPERLANEPLQDRDMIFIERQTDGKYLDIKVSASMYRVYRHTSVFKGVAYWTE